MEGLEQLLPILINDVPPDPRDPKPNKPQQLPDPEHAPSNSICYYDLVSKSQPEPVPESPSVA